MSKQELGFSEEALNEDVVLRVRETAKLLLGGNRYFADDDVAALGQAISSLRQENERLRGALKPFSDALDDCDDEELLPENDKWEVWERPCGMSINTGHLKSARQALTKEG